MAVTNSTDLKVYVGGVAVACATDATLTVSHSVREVLCKDTGAWRDVVPGLRSWNISGSGLMDIGATNGGPDLVEMAELAEDMEPVVEAARQQMEQTPVPVLTEMTEWLL